MNKNVIFNKRFLCYALLLHGGVAASFALFDSEDNKDESVNQKRIIEVDVSQPIVDNAITAETFSSSEIEDELRQIESMSTSFKNNTKLTDANIKEKEKELRALEVHSKKTKENLLKEKKKLQLEKKKIQDEKDRALIEKQKIQKEKKEMEAELKRLQEDAEKKAIAKREKEKREKQRLADEKKKLAKLEAAKKKETKTLTAEQWLKTNSGMAEFNRYTGSLMGKVKGRWIKPSESKTGWECKVEITQTKEGRIKGIRKLKCDPNNEKFYQSVHRAVMQSSPLPIPSDKRLFDNKITITFIVD